VKICLDEPASSGGLTSDRPPRGGGAKRQLTTRREIVLTLIRCT
jgi:hypothetical protein